MSYQLIKVEVEEPAGIITINRPDKLNALNEAVLKELEAAVEDLGTRPEVRAIILTGAGEKAFVAGADISELAELDTRGGIASSKRGQKLFSWLESCGKMIIAAVNGFALGGGCELALACDVRIASENARLGLPEVSLGIIPGYGGTQRLPRLVGRGIALELILSGRQVKAEEALRIGLVNRVVPQDELLQAALDLARKVARNGPVAVSAAKQAVDRGLDLGFQSGSELESALFGMLCTTQDMREGMSAFLEKRQPEFRGA